MMPQISCDLLIPQSLTDLIESDFWPLTPQATGAQNLKPLIPLPKIQSFAPEEHSIYFYPPPFRTMKQASARSSVWLLSMSAMDEIDENLTLVLGDFGPGSDTLFALDYRKSLDNPSVIRLQWNLEASNHWVEIAPSFAEFAKMILD